jgi:DNA modification methylase
MTIRLITADCRDALRQLPDESVHCVVTSPPYWGLRDYGIAGQLGMEKSLGEYIAVMVNVFREVRRVLRDDGTLWLNLGDSYANANPGSGGKCVLAGAGRAMTEGRYHSNKRDIGQLKPKDLCGIPWRVAFALQVDGWYLRQDIIWSKPNPMPESVTDRCTKAHEYIFLLSKSQQYYYDQQAIAEQAMRSGEVSIPSETTLSRGQALGRSIKPSGNATKDTFTVADTRNKRSVWEIATQPFSEAHFATFPPALIEPCILAGCPEKCCAKCGMPWVRSGETRPSIPQRTGDWKATGENHRNDIERKGGFYPKRKAIEHWAPTCPCSYLSSSTIPGTVLDPFGGAGTTGLVADRLGRNAILIELNPKYAAMAKCRIYDDAPLFVDVDDLAVKLTGAGAIGGL